MSWNLRSRGGLAVFALLLACLLTAGLHKAGAAQAEDEAKKAPAKADDGEPATFDSAKAAAKALVEAAARNDDVAILRLIGSKNKAAMQSGTDPVVRKERAEFAKRAKEAAGLEKNKDGSMTLVIGENQWPLPIPIVQKDGKWSLDFAAGKEEVESRRIGRNELRAMEICKVYVQAQVDFASMDRDGDEVREYAQKIASTPGKHDGLYWEAAEEEEASPLGPLVASWREEGIKRPDGKKRVPFGGYYFRILKGQGGAAPGGRHSYVVNGNMIAGFALVAYPAKYGKTGIMTFMVSHHGKLIERDLGPDCALSVQAMKGFNPHQGWTVVKEGN